MEIGVTCATQGQIIVYFHVTALGFAISYKKIKKKNTKIDIRKNPKIDIRKTCYACRRPLFSTNQNVLNNLGRESLKGHLFQTILTDKILKTFRLAAMKTRFLHGVEIIEQL